MHDNAEMYRAMQNLAWVISEKIRFAELREQDYHLVSELASVSATGRIVQSVVSTDQAAEPKRFEEKNESAVNQAGKKKKRQ